MEPNFISEKRHLLVKQTNNQKWLYHVCETDCCCAFVLLRLLLLSNKEPKTFNELLNKRHN